MASAEEELRTAIMARLTVGAAKISWDVYDQVLPNSIQHVELGDFISDKKVNKNIAEKITVQFHAWEFENKSYAGVLGALEDVSGSLTHTKSAVISKLTCTNWWVNAQESLSANSVKNVSEEWRHGILNFVFTMQGK